jgi:hypothetical protein
MFAAGEGARGGNDFDAVEGSPGEGAGAYGYILGCRLIPAKGIPEV